MKTSVKFLLAAFVVLLASLTAYNMALRTEYRSGAYQDPLRFYTPLAFKDFTEVAVPAASIVNVKIMAGPFKVLIGPNASKYVQVSQKNGRLLITASFPDARPYLGPREAVIISCPRLTSLATDASYQVEGQPHTDRNEEVNRGRTLVQGFTQDSLALRQDRASRIELTNNRLGLLRAVAGTTPGSHSILQVNNGNHIAAASLTLAHQSELVLDNVQIPQLHHSFGDSTKVTLAGTALSSVLK
jgi:hypothetical protein